MRNVFVVGLHLFIIALVSACNHSSNLAQEAAGSGSGAAGGPAVASLGGLEPQDSIVVVETEENGKVVRAAPGLVISVEGPTAYVGGRRLMVHEGFLNRQPGAAPEIRYFGRVGPAGAERRIPLRPVVTLVDSGFAVLAGAATELPPPTATGDGKLPDLVEGATLTAAVVRSKEFERLPNEYERYREPVKVARVEAAGDGPALFLRLEGRGGFGFLLDDKNRPIARCDGRQNETVAFPLGTRLGGLPTELETLRIRVSRMADDEVLVEFAARSIDAFQAGMKPTLLVAHPAKSDLQRPSHELLHGDEAFILRNGKWLRPPEGTLVEWKQVDRFDAAFEMPPELDPWCRAANWYATYRFKPSEHPRTVWYQAAFVDGTGLLSTGRNRDSHVYFPRFVGQSERYVHPVNQYDQGVPVAMPTNR